MNDETAGLAELIQDRLRSVNRQLCNVRNVAKGKRAQEELDIVQLQLRSLDSQLTELASRIRGT